MGVLCGSGTSALAGVLGEMKFSVYATVACMSIPAFLFVMPFCFIQKPVPPGDWSKVLNKMTASDFEVLMWTSSNPPSTFLFFVLSGLLTFAYNIIQFTILYTLSPTATAFADYSNKAAVAFLALLLPCLQVHKLQSNLWLWLA